ncbi:glucosyltransferase domain-containing protein [Serratia nevei]|uniref:glucosyltransferase domain-containing protein n=1 Tax=Serratia nevei TaxID=2703794 RepID=UPI002858F001|nr:glucosyltransferase domain-containing protein [Serratia nevei]MDR8482109.1 glucosyltransferase domain-containing protein [Serratia nevei]
MRIKMFCKIDKKALFLYSGIALLFIYPLIQAGIFYRDDLDRAITGQYGWRGLGRPVADILMKVLSASGHYNLDLYPYTMIASCLFIGGASLLLSDHLSRLEIPSHKLVAALLIFNPFMLQNIAYRYDSLGMSVAFFLAVMAYTYKANNPIRQVSVKLLAGVLSLTLYQPCANIFIGLLAVDIMIVAVKNNCKATGIINKTFKNTVLFISFYLVYMLFFATKSNSRAEIVPANSKGLEHLLATISALKDMILSYFYGPTYIYFLIPIISGLIFTLIANRHKKKTTLPFGLYWMLSLIVFLVSLMGPTIFLKDAPVFPRTLVSFSVCLVLIAIPVVCFLPKLKYLSLIPVITVIAFSAQLSSAIKSQREYEDFIFNMIGRDLMINKEITTIGTVGQVNIDERTKLLMENKPLIGYFLSPASEFLASFQLINKGFPQTLHGYGDEQNNKNVLSRMISSGIKPISTNKEYSLFISGNTAIVSLGANNN